LRYDLGVLKLQAVNVRRREPDLGVISPVPDPEPAYALLVFIKDLIERALAFLRRLADICDLMRLIAFHWAKVEQRNRLLNSQKLSKFFGFNGLAG
jgi:hypothetical protein